jgi:hypothetical protein
MQERLSVFSIALYSLFTVFYAPVAPAFADEPPSAAVPAPADEQPPKPPADAVWYISNPAGMAVSPSPSRLAALRSKNCLALAIVGADSLPPILAPYYKPSLKVDFRMLFESGKLIREQWIFRDEKARGLVIAAAVVERNTAPSIAFIECYNENGFIEEERLFDDKETYIKYFYKERILVRTETRIWEKIEKPLESLESVEEQESELEEAPAVEYVEAQESELEEDAADESVEEREPEFEVVETTVYTDYYRYSVSDSLRTVERVFQKGGPEIGRLRIAFPSVGLRQEIDSNFVKPASTQRSAFLTGDESVSDVLYTTDARGRVLSETHRDENRGVVVETINTWVGGRISVVEQKFFEPPKRDEEESSETPEAVEDEVRGEVIDEKRIEYEYNSAGDRVLEKNYNNGTLERTVRTNGNQEIEEIYMDGKVMLRAIWEGNRKIKEERVK